jgi:hypothetical protein
MDPKGLVELHDVEVVRKTRLVLVYRIDGREVRLPSLEVQPGSVVTPGQHGTLILPKWLAKEFGI